MNWQFSPEDEGHWAMWSLDIDDYTRLLVVCRSDHYEVLIGFEGERLQYPIGMSIEDVKAAAVAIARMR